MNQHIRRPGDAPAYETLAEERAQLPPITTSRWNWVPVVLVLLAFLYVPALVILSSPLWVPSALPTPAPAPVAEKPPAPPPVIPNVPAPQPLAGLNAADVQHLQNLNLGLAQQLQGAFGELHQQLQQQRAVLRNLNTPRLAAPAPVMPDRPDAPAFTKKPFGKGSILEVK
jgi:hypothetical protein